MATTTLRRIITEFSASSHRGEIGQSLVLQLSRHLTTTSVLSLPVHIEDEVYNRQRQVLNLGKRMPTLAPDTWLAPSAIVCGDVDVFERVSIWYNAVLRGDLNSIKVGAFSNIQDRTVVHAARSSPTGLPAATVIGRNVSIGQSCVLRSVVIEDECVIGDKCMLLEGSLMEKNSILGPGSVLAPGRRVPSGEYWAGKPAKFVRKLSKDEKMEIAPLAAAMYPIVDQHSSEFLPYGAWEEAANLRSILKPGLVEELMDK